MTVTTNQFNTVERLYNTIGNGWHNVRTKALNDQMVFKILLDQKVDAK